MARQPSQLTQDIQYAIRQGMTNKEIAELLSCTRAKVASVRHRNKAKAKAKQREYNRRYKARKEKTTQPYSVTEVTDREIDALRAVPNVRTQVTMEGPVKYTWVERIRILFRGW